MSEEHIIDLLDDDSPAGLSVEHRSRVEGHIVQCPDCHRAYAAAHATESLLRARAAQQIEVPPFFATRVMAALREQQSKPLILAPASWWHTTKAFLFSGAAMAALLGALIFVTPESPTQDQPRASDAPESVVFTEDTQTVESPSNADAIDVVFRPEDADAGNQR